MTNRKDHNGLFIVLEGIDGSGKSSLVDPIARYFIDKGKTVWVTSEPTTSEIGELARETLKQGNRDRLRALLMAADRIDHTREIREFLKDPNAVVICDRYKHSALAYQTLTFPAEDINVLNKGCLEPDLVIYMDISPDVALSRIDLRGGKKEVFEKLDLLKKVKDNYDKIDMGRVIKIDNSYMTIETTRATVLMELVKEGF